MIYERLVRANTGKRKTKTNAKEPELFPRESEFPGKSALKNQPTVSNSSNSIVLTFLKNWLQKLRLDCFEHVMSLARRFLEQAAI